ncbi:squamous cell carcinoma antigen recognized by T-cells 3, partial [Tanacetum coccineum]
GLAYVDFSDDTHLEAAVAKNKQMLLGRKLSIARSNPKGKRKGSAGHKASTEKGQGILSILCVIDFKRDLFSHYDIKFLKIGLEPTANRASSQLSQLFVLDKNYISYLENEVLGRQGKDRGHGEVELKGRNTFAVPRTVRALGWSGTSKPPASVTAEGGEEKPKSNEELRNLFLKKS